MMKYCEGSHTSFIGSSLTVGRIAPSVYPLYGPYLLIHHKIGSLPANKKKTWKDNSFPESVCKVRPIEYYLQLLPLPVSLGMAIEGK